MQGEFLKKSLDFSLFVLVYFYSYICNINRPMLHSSTQTFHLSLIEQFRSNLAARFTRVEVVYSLGLSVAQTENQKNRIKTDKNTSGW